MTLTSARRTSKTFGYEKKKRRRVRRRRRKRRKRRWSKKKKEKKYLTPIEEREPHLLREQCRVGTGPSNVKETRGTSITSSNLTSPPLSEAAARPAISCMISSRPTIGRRVRVRLPPSPLNKTRCERRGTKLKIEGVRVRVFGLATALLRFACSFCEHLLVWPRPVDPDRTCNCSSHTRLRGKYSRNSITNVINKYRGLSRNNLM